MESRPQVVDNRVRYIFNEMADEYDDLSDLWYSWLFSRLHYLITGHVIRQWTTSMDVLDVGCGTGLQSFLYALGSARVIGLDISDRLIESARRKATTFMRRPTHVLFESPYSFVKEYNEKIRRLLPKDPQLTLPRFDIGDARALPYPNSCFDHVNCCGSTLSFIDDHSRALREMARVLRPGGTFVLEVEAKYSPDSLWMLADFVLRGRLGFEATAADLRSVLLTRPSEHASVVYPFGESGDPVYMDLKLFAIAQLRRELNEVSLQTSRSYSIHSLTNVIPSVLLDSAHPSALTKYLFARLARFEERLGGAKFGCSVVLIGYRHSSAE